MDVAFKPVVVTISGILFVVDTDDSFSSSYYHVPVCVVNCCINFLCYHVDAVVSHIYTGVVAAILCGIYGWEAYVEAFGFCWC